MNTNLSSKKLSLRKCFEIFYHLSIFCMLFEWACPMFTIFGFIGLNEIAMSLAGISFIGCVFIEKKAYFTHLFEVLKSSKYLCIALLGYVIYGIVTVFLGADLMFVVLRYVVVIQMVLFAFMTLYYLLPVGATKEVEAQKMKSFLLNVSITAGIISVFALLGYYIDFYTTYFQKISTIKDYNQYTSILLMGLICLSTLVIRSEMSFVKRYAILIPYATLISLCVYAAGSRRSDVLLLVVALIISVYAVICEAKRFGSKFNWKGAVSALCAMTICLSVAGVVSYFNFELVGNISEKRLAYALKLKAEGKATPELLEKISMSGAHVEMDSTLKGLVDGSGMDSREAIWNIAIDEIKHSRTKEIILGHGASYSWELYDDLSNPDVKELRVKYYKEDSDKLWMNPHNLFLQDMLEGGAILFVLQLAILLFIAISFVRILKYRVSAFLPLLLANAVLYVTLLLSSARGMSAHKFFWVLIAFQIVFNYYISKSPKKEK